MKQYSVHQLCWPPSSCAAIVSPLLGTDLVFFMIQCCNVGMCFLKNLRVFFTSVAACLGIAESLLRVVPICQRSATVEFATPRPSARFERWLLSLSTGRILFAGSTCIIFAANDRFHKRTIVPLGSSCNSAQCTMLASLWSF